MKNLKLLFITAAVFISTAVSAQSKIGYINSLELLSYMPDIAKSDSLLKVMANDMQKQYDAYVLDYQQNLADYQQNVASWSDVKREAVEEDLQGKEKRISDYQESSQSKIADKKKELYDPTVKKANDIIQTVGKESKLTGILDTSTGALIYVGDDMVNIMPIVMQKLGLKYTPPPAQ